MTTYDYIIHEQKRLREKDARRAAATTAKREQGRNGAQPPSSSPAPTRSNQPVNYEEEKKLFDF
jgi:hypothetical protein